MGRGQRAGEGPGPPPYGPRARRQLASCTSLGDALRLLSASRYGASIEPEETLAAAQRDIARALLWDLRVLAGWLPPDGLRLLRILAAWFEVANVDELLQSIAGRPAEPSSASARSRRLGAAAPGGQPSVTCGPRWPSRPGGTLAASRYTRCAWACVRSWAARAAALGDPARTWAARAAALLVAGERLAAGRRPDPVALGRRPGTCSEPRLTGPARCPS